MLLYKCFISPMVEHVYFFIDCDESRNCRHHSHCFVSADRHAHILSITSIIWQVPFYFFMSSIGTYKISLVLRLADKASN